MLQSPPPSPCSAAPLTRLTSPLYLLLAPVTRLAAVTKLMARDGDSHADLKQEMIKYLESDYQIINQM